MEHHHQGHHDHQPDFGTGQKRLGIYLWGLIACSVLTLLAFWAVTAHFSKMEMLAIIYIAACIQLLVQVICFLRLNTATPQGRVNVMSILFTFVILISVVFGSLWIMWSLNYYMMH